MLVKVLLEKVIESLVKKLKVSLDDEKNNELLDEIDRLKRRIEKLEKASSNTKKKGLLF